MGRKCSVKSCTSQSAKPEHVGVTYHKIPLHPDVRPKWLSLCHIPTEKMGSKMLFVCSRHFLRADFCNFKGKKYMLKQGVLPSVFPWDKSRLQAIKAVVRTKKDEEDEAPKKTDGTNVVKEEQNDNADDTVEADSVIDLSDVNDQTLSDTCTDIKTESIEIKEEAQETESESGSTVEPEVEPEGSIPDINEEAKLEQLKSDPFDQLQRSQNASPVSVPISFNTNSRIEVMDNNNVWHSAKINEIDYEESEVLIHFEKALNKCDEWISMSSPRLRPLQPKSLENFEVGERCMATWSDYRKFPATITKKLSDDSYEVLFDDGFVKVVKSHKMNKMKPTQSSPLFEPAKTTKQERRDRKRKLNVAALFSKRPKLSGTNDKKPKSGAGSSANQGQFDAGQAQEESVNQEQSHVSASVETSSHLMDWQPSWENGKPIGIESTIEGADGFRKSTIVPDPRLPAGWTKHLTQRTYGQSIGKWDAIILAPDGKKFRTRQDIQNYLDVHPGIEASMDMFDFRVNRGGRRGGKPKPKAITETPPPPPLSESEPATETAAPEVAVVEELPVSLKIIFEDDVYKCPIEGCDKSFRRENLALMHVKHYHSEYTKYLESMPNVADLAYARTVGENLDRSPGPPKQSGAVKMDKPPATPKTPKVPSNAGQEALHSGSSPIPDKSLRDSEIIKLLNQKSTDVANDSQPLPAGIKTLLPVRHSNKTNELSDEKGITKRKKAAAPLPLETPEALKGKTVHQTTTAPILESPQLPHQSPSSQQQPHQATPVNSQPPSDDALTGVNPIPSAFDLAPPPAGLETTQAPSVTQFDGVIFEGGKIIKLERMKQEEIINCTCGFTEEDGLMIQCELCLCWQHAYCNNIQKESEVPEKYVCYICQHPLRERQSMKYLHDQDWLKQGTLPVASYHFKDKSALEKRFDKLRKCHDLSGGLLELKDYMHTLAVKLKIAEAKNHPKLYLWSKPWEKHPLPEKVVKGEPEDLKPKLESPEFHQKGGVLTLMNKSENSNDAMMMMMLKSGKEEMPMLNVQSNLAPIIPRPEAAIDSDDCRLNLLSHISHSESLVDERLDDFEKQLDALEQGMDLELDEDYPKTRQTLQLLMRDLDSLKRFSELPMM